MKRPMVIDELHRPMDAATCARLTNIWRRVGIPVVFVTTTPHHSRLRLAWWRLCSWFREVVR